MKVVVDFTRLLARSGREVFESAVIDRVDSVDDAVVKFMSSYPSRNIYDLEVREV